MLDLPRRNTGGQSLSIGEIMAGYEQTFLEQITNIDAFAKV